MDELGEIGVMRFLDGVEERGGRMTATINVKLGPGMLVNALLERFDGLVMMGTMRLRLLNKSENYHKKNGKKCQITSSNFI